MTWITTLADDEVFVFGSNEQGFHGAGAAGLACRGDARNNWRNDPDFRALMTLARKPDLNPDLRGKWAVFGIGRGFQQGREGKSYAVATVTRPGTKRSVSRRDIYLQLVNLWAFITYHAEWTFLIPPLGEGYAGYTRGEMDEVWAFLRKQHGMPDNVRFVGRDAGVAAT